MFEYLLNLNVLLSESGGTRYGLTSILSEATFCLWSGSVRYLSANKARESGLSFTEQLVSQSLDTYSEEHQEAEQLKSTIMPKDPVSSFGPTSEQDVTYFLNFFNDGNLNGTFDVFRIPNHFFEGVTCSGAQDGSFVDRKSSGKRPRFSITTKIIEPNNISPLATKVNLW